jgi:tetratricopeptide (TPR) repeat protein
MKALVGTLQRRRRTRRLLSRAAWAVAAVTVLVAGLVLANRVPVERCAKPPPLWSSLWSSPVRLQASQAFDKAGLPFARTAFQAVDDALGQFLRAWQAQRREACIQAYGTGAHTQALLQRQLACLDRRLLDAEALAHLFRSADASIVTRAPQAVSTSLSLNICEDPPAWMTAQPGDGGKQREALEAHAKKVSELRALQSAGTPAAFLERAVALEATYSATPTINDSAGHAEVLTLLAQAQEDAGHLEAARQDFLQAVQVADRAGADELRAEAELALAWAHVLAADTKSAHASLDRAVALLQRIPESLPVHLERLRLQSSAALAAREAKEAIRLSRERVEEAERGYGAGSLVAAQTHADLAMTLAKAGALDEARAELLVVVGELERRLGPDHPSLGIHLRKLSEVELHLGKSADSLAHARRALAILEPRLGRSHLEVGGAQYLVAVGEADAKSPPAVVAPAFDRAREIFTRALGREHPQVALVLFDQARYWAVQGDAAKAEPLFAQACGMYERVLSEDALYTADCWGTEGQSLLDLGEPKKAGPLLEKAQKNFEKLGMMGTLEGLTLRANLARWRAARGDSPRAVRELAQILRELETLPSHPESYRETYRTYLKEALARIPPSRRARWIRFSGETAPLKAATSPP